MNRWVQWGEGREALSVNTYSTYSTYTIYSTYSTYSTVLSKKHQRKKEDGKERQHRKAQNKKKLFLVGTLGCCERIKERKSDWSQHYSLSFTNKKQKNKSEKRCQLYLCSFIQQSVASLGYEGLSACSTVSDLMEAAQKCKADCYGDMLSSLAVPVPVKLQEARDVTLRYHQANISLCEGDKHSREGVSVFSVDIFCSNGCSNVWTHYWLSLCP